MISFSRPDLSRILRSTVLMALVLILTGCFNYTEEMWLEEDGSGRMTSEMTMNLDALKNFGSGLGNNGSVTTSTTQTGPNGFSEAEMRAKLEGKKGIRLIKTESTQTDTGFSVRWELEFDSLADLAALEEHESGSMAGANAAFYKGLSWTKSGGKMQFQRTIGDDSASAAGPDPMSMGLATMMFGNSNMTFTTHFPGAVNLTSGTKLEDGKSVRWVIPLAQMGTRQVMTAEVEKPGLPWMWIGIAAFVMVDTLIVALILAWIVKRQDQMKKAKSAAAEATEPAAPPQTLRTPDEDFRPR